MVDTMVYFFAEVHSCYHWFYAILTKDDSINAFKTFLAEISSYNMGFSVKTLKTDNGDEFTSNEFAQLLADHQISFRTTTPHTPNSNAFSERFNRGPEVKTQVSQPRSQQTNKIPKHLQHFVALAADHEPDKNSFDKVEPEDIDMLL